MEHERLRLVAWNCAGAFHHKVQALTAMEPDIAVLSEVSKKTSALVGNDVSAVWTGTHEDYGLAVMGRNGWKIERVGPIVEERLFLPVRAVRGSVERHLVGVCVKKDGDYVAPTLRAISTLSNFISEKAAVLAGDFNQSVWFDSKRKQEAHFAQVLNVLDHLNLVSAWHTFQEESPGAEAAPTYFHQRNRKQGFHIDYVFVPRNVTVSAAVLGTYDEFVATGLSDHVPLMVELRQHQSD